MQPAKPLQTFPPIFLSLSSAFLVRSFLFPTLIYREPTPFFGSRLPRPWPNQNMKARSTQYTAMPTKKLSSAGAVKFFT